MKKNGILNSDISKILSDLGHTDQITIADCGLPVPDGVKKIDLSLKLGIPSFKDVLDTVLLDMQIEKIIIAEEIKTKNTIQNNYILDKVKSNKTNNTCVDVEYIPHEDFKKLTSKSKVIIRSGECTPYSNIILQSGVIF